MVEKTEQKYAIAHGRVSDPLDAFRGSSFADQENIARLSAERLNATIVKFFEEPYSGRRSNRPFFEEILRYIKNSPVPIHYYIFKSIDRFTRAGVQEYIEMKARIEELGVELIDAYGVIQGNRNTLEHLGLQYDWSIHSPSEQMQYTEASRAKAEVRDVLTRLVGGSVRSVRAGYAVRRALDGFKSERVFDESGKKRVIWKPDPQRAKYYEQMFNLRAAGSMTDEEIVARINAMGFRTQALHKWDKYRTKIIGKTGGVPLTVKQFQRSISNPRYAGVNIEKWTEGKPLLAKYDGLIAVDTFNQANRGKIVINKLGGDRVQILRNQKEVKRLKNNPLYPYKLIRCADCGLPVLGSASTGKSGKKFPAYHCGGAKKGPRVHAHWRIPKDTFEKQVAYFVEHLQFTPAFLMDFEKILIRKYCQREKEVLVQSSAVNKTLADLQTEQAAKVEAYSTASSEVVRRRLAEQIEELEQRMTTAKSERDSLEVDEDDIKTSIREWTT